MINGIPPRQLELLHLIAEGATGQQCAVRMAISTHTVDKMRGELYKRCGVHKSTELVWWALQHGYLEPPARVA